MNFASARIAAGFTQSEVARRLEIDQSAVSYWETGKHIPRGPLLVRLADLYGCTVDELLGRAPAGARAEGTINTPTTILPDGTT